MQWKTLALSLALSVHDASASPAHGLMARQFAQSSMMRFQCSQLVFDRIDPLVQPGMLPSTHMHQIVGGSAFNASMPALELDPSTEASCTTCDFAEDFRQVTSCSNDYMIRSDSSSAITGPQTSTSKHAMALSSACPRWSILACKAVKVSQYTIFLLTMARPMSQHSLRASAC